MAEPTPRGIQATLADYFQDTEYFDLQEANELLLEHQQRDINAESIRARIYEGINKGLFERVGKGLYTVTRKDEQGRENTCLLINGDGRDLSMIPDSTISAIITDHPYLLSNSLKGGNRNFADYELFQYNENDMREKARVLIPGCFAVEFLPEENGDNYQYLFQVKDMARKAGLEYYAQVPWKKSGFVANTGRKAKDTENIVFFSKGRARDLRPDAKKDKQYEKSRTIVEYQEFIPGGTTVRYSDMGGMGSSSETNVEPVDVNIRLSVAKEDAEKVKELLEAAWKNAVLDSFDNSPLDKDYGGSYSLAELFEMPVQEYMLRYLDSHDISYVDLSPGVKDIFKADTEVIVNPTNLIGPMGAGLAKSFKEHYEELEDVYKDACRRGAQTPAKQASKIIASGQEAIHEGDLFWYDPDHIRVKHKVLCFPTKKDWKNPSDLALIEAGLKTFVKNYKQLNISSITFPKLGCGLGGLDWEKEVKPLMQKYLADLPDLKVQVCGDTLNVDKKAHFMSGAAGMLPTVFDVPPVRKGEKIHQAEKPLMLLEQILNFVTLPGETALDQFAGSGVLGEAALKTGRNSILIEKDAETFLNLTKRLEVLGSIQALTPEEKNFISIGKDALVAQDAYQRTGDDSIPINFQKNHDIEPQKLYDTHIDMHLSAEHDKDVRNAMAGAMDAIRYLDIKADNLVRAEGEQEPPASTQKVEYALDNKSQPRILECSSRGDRRFSALFAMVKIKGKEQSIEEWYQNAKRTSDGKKAGKGKPFDYIVDPFTGDKLPAKDAVDLYRGLWITYFTKNPDLVEYAKGFDEFHDMFRGKNTVNCQADVIAAYIKDSDSFVAEVKRSTWYKNMAAKKKPPLNKQIQSAERKAEEQMSFFGAKDKSRNQWTPTR